MPRGGLHCAGSGAPLPWQRTIALPWHHRRKIDEMEKLEELQGQREQLAVAMQELDPEAQRLIYPILRLKMVRHSPPASPRTRVPLSPAPFLYGWPSP